MVYSRLNESLQKQGLLEEGGRKKRKAPTNGDGKEDGVDGTMRKKRKAGPSKEKGLLGEAAEGRREEVGGAMGGPVVKEEDAN